jgi:hypothetical protein
LFRAKAIRVDHGNINETSLIGFSENRRIVGFSG